jgi:hypothetical protein
MVAVIVLADIDPSHRFWGYMRFVIGRFSIGRLPGLQFFKILGSGQDGGFQLRPSASRQGLFCLFDTAENARYFLTESRVIQSYRRCSREIFTAVMSAYSSKGSWAGTVITPDEAEPPSGPIAALTRASIHPLKARAFWRRSPAAEIALTSADGCLLAVGLGEAPLLRQATFSIWHSTEAMNRYARAGAHLDAIRASLSGKHFSESMFVRFRLLSAHGVWKGRSFG